MPEKSKLSMVMSDKTSSYYDLKTGLIQAAISAFGGLLIVVGNLVSAIKIQNEAHKTESSKEVD